MLRDVWAGENPLCNIKWSESILINLKDSSFDDHVICVRCEKFILVGAFHLLLCTKVICSV